MHYVYLLQSKKDSKLYTGCTADLKKRLKMHNDGRVESTKHRRPLKLVFYEAFVDQQDAFARERWLKTGWGHNQIDKLLANYLHKI